MQKIVFVSHCILNTAAKVVLYEQDAIDAEEELRRRFVGKALTQGVQIVQLPCPEFTLYGACRWGHVSDQFDNPFFRGHCRTLLAPVVQELREYLAHPERFAVLGVVGVDGSPSCGVDYTCYGNWYGSFEGRTDLAQALSTCRLDRGQGIFMDELRTLLREANLQDKVPVTALFAGEPQKCLELLDK